MDRDPLIAPLTSSPLANGTLRTMIELTKSFTFEAAHTLSRVVEREASLRIHGHSYRAEVTLAGEPDPESGMLIDLGLLDQALADIRARLDHHFLDEVPGLYPATLERLARFIFEALAPRLPGLVAVAVCRDALGERCLYRP
jgi:6-pyruvoyltetrahydropterin/6-carboxytetrahydropterin synthase